LFYGTTLGKLNVSEHIPIAPTEDSLPAELAVRAALAIQRSLTDLNRKNAGSGKSALAARIAIVGMRRARSTSG
jgi:hypothetical protein